MARSEDVERRFHEEWLGMVQPEGLVVSIPVLLDAQCMQRNPPTLQHRLRELAPEGKLDDPWQLFPQLLDIPLDNFDRGDALPKELAHYHERSSVTPTAALRRAQLPDAPAEPEDLVPDIETPATRAGKPYALLVLEVPTGRFDENDDAAWSYPPALKLERLLRDTRVEVGLLLSPTRVRLVYAPHGQAAGWLDFEIAAMTDPGGRPMLDAFVMLVKRRRIEDPEWPLQRLLDESRSRQANVTNALAKQVFEALQILLDGYQGAAPLDAAMARGEDHIYAGILSVLLRMVFVLYAEDRGLLPADDALYQENYALIHLFNELEEDRAAFPDTMPQRLGAWPRVLALFRLIHDGARVPGLHIPARRGELFDPDRFPFLEGRTAIDDAPEAPRVSDDVAHRILQRLLVLDNERISYRSLDVEQIGSVYEKLMGYHVWRADAEAVCLKGEGAWVTAEEVLAQPAAMREAFLVDERGLPKSDGKKLGAGLKGAKRADEILALLDTVRKSGTERNPPGRLVLQPGAERRRTSSHYTPRSLSEPVVRRALEPLLGAMGGAPTAEQLLQLKVCDPAMGSGAFLVEACRFLADQVVAAWSREPTPPAGVPSDPHERLMRARRLVAQRCLYGVDKNAMAVTLGRLSLWLVTMAKDEPFTFVDHALKHGDSLVGLTLDQIRAFHWKPGAQAELFATVIDQAVSDALAERERILNLANCDTEACFLQKEQANAHAEESLARARLIADLCVGAFFAKETDKEREADRKSRLERVSQWLATGGPPPADLLEKQHTLRSGQYAVPAFHWMLEFPEVFSARRPDPLDAGRIDAAAWMDSFIGNPPFMGKNGITESGGQSYLSWLLVLHPDSHGNADLVAHFFRRADFLLGKHGTMGLVATKTIGQGDTRSTGLQSIVRTGARIYDAIPIMKWPGERDAAVSIATVHLAKGRLASVEGLECRIEGHIVHGINSRLRAGSERPDPITLRANENLCFVGSYVLGMGFVLAPDERQLLIERDHRNAERIFPYLGGEEVNTSPTQSFSRYVINFGDMSLEEAERWPDLIRIVREKVKPERDRLADNADGRRRRTYWWLFGRETPGLNHALKESVRCLVTAQVTKHLVFSFQPPDRIFSKNLFVFIISEYARFSVLQSRLHERWTRLLSSTLEDRLNYAPSDCFGNFPFPEAGAETERIGRKLYEKRASLMAERKYGLTVLYNQLKDPKCHDPEIVVLRRMHEEMDRVVLEAYGWSDIAVPPYEEPTTPEGRQAFAAFEDAVIDRLFELNARYAAEEAKAKP